MSVIEIKPIEGRIDASIGIPGSKSYTNRTLLIAAMAEGESLLNQALFSEDTQYMARVLRQLGVEVESDEEACQFRVLGMGGRIDVPGADLFVGNAGTAMRFLTGYVTLGQGIFSVDGVQRMRERPIQDLLDGLTQLGVRAYARFGNGCPPVVVETNGLEGGRTRMAGDKSSQYFTAILLVAPYARRDVEIEVMGDLVSKPYVDMTISSMADFGVKVVNEGYERFVVKQGQRYRARQYAIEPDASNASYFLAAAAVTGGRVRVEHISYGSAQGDVRFVDVLERMGCQVVRDMDYLEVTGPDRLLGVDVDMNAMPDVAQTLSAIAPFAEGKTRIRNVATMQIKETDRIAALATELRKLGVQVQEFRDGLEIQPAHIRPAEVDTYDDHRMAMSFSVTGLKTHGVKIKDPECVKKTFPDFFERLEWLRPEK